VSPAWQLKSFMTTPFIRRVILYTTLPLVFLLLGFVPMWLKAGECSTGLSEVGQQLSLASAVIDTQRGDYEPALQLTSSFFTSFQAETDNRDASALSPAESAGVLPLFAERDDFITLLARRDPVSAERLSDLYGSYRQVV
jgi:hypothetical protein